MLEIRGLRKAYGDIVALDGVDLDIAAGEVCALLGPNGAGKTTLVSVVAGLRRPDAGTATVGGLDALRRRREVRRLIGLAPQELAIYPSISAREGLMFFGELGGLWGARLRERIDELGEALDLTPLLDRRAHTLSGGEKRRLHTAMALLHRPPLLLLDEPSVGVDVLTRQRLLAFVREQAAVGETAVCYSTHYLHEVDALGASVAIIDRGRIVARGDASALVRAHSHPLIEVEFEGDAPELHAGLEYVREGELLRVTSPDPKAGLGAVITALGADAQRVRSVQVLEPSLEGVFLSLTGRKYETADA